MNNKKIAACENSGIKCWTGITEVQVWDVNAF